MNQNITIFQQTHESSMHFSKLDTTKYSNLHEINKHGRRLKSRRQILLAWKLVIIHNFLSAIQTFSENISARSHQGIIYIAVHIKDLSVRMLIKGVKSLAFLLKLLRALIEKWTQWIFLSQQDITSMHFPSVSILCIEPELSFLLNMVSTLLKRERGILHS